jgi:micrococcal nuclease
VIEINRVLDGDTIDVTIDLGFDLYKKERVRVAGVDTPEKRTRDDEEKKLGYDATNWLKDKLEGAIAGDDDLVIRTELVGGVGKYGRLLGWLYIGDAELSLNEQMITERDMPGHMMAARNRKTLRNCVKFAVLMAR